MHLGLIGYGNIATTLVELIGRADGPRLSHLSVLVRKGRQFDSRSMPSLRGVESRYFHECDSMIQASPDLVIECAGQECVAQHVPAFLGAGIDVVVASVGALADPATAQALEAASRAGGARMILPAGAIGGIDLLRAVAAAGGLAVTYRGTKPPAAWSAAPGVELPDLDNLAKATLIFRGTARQAARHFPRNANVAATIALAGAGFDETTVELTADPAARGNRHSFEVNGPIANFRVEIENVPSSANRSSSLATTYSIFREIRNRTEWLVI